MKMQPCDRHEENAGIVVHELSLRNSEDFEGSNKICKLRLVMSQNPMELKFFFAELLARKGKVDGCDPSSFTDWYVDVCLLAVLLG